MEERDVEYLSRLRSNKPLQTLAAPYLKWPPGRLPEQHREWCHDLEYLADKWLQPTLCRAGGSGVLRRPVAPRLLPGP